MIIVNLKDVHVSVTTVFNLFKKHKEGYEYERQYMDSEGYSSIRQCTACGKSPAMAFDCYFCKDCAAKRCYRRYDYETWEQFYDRAAQTNGYFDHECRFTRGGFPMTIGLIGEDEEARLRRLAGYKRDGWLYVKDLGWWDSKKIMSTSWLKRRYENGRKEMLDSYLD